METKFRLYSKYRGMSPSKTFKEFCLNTDNRFLTLPDLVVMQYTGLKDKNGKEIYEGDIISYKYYRGFSGGEKEIIAKVEFIDGCFGFYEFVGYFNRYDLNESKVIGNIYENPELLKDEK